MWRACLLVLLWIVAAPTVAAAQSVEADRDAARALAEAALGLYSEGDYAGALDRFRAAERIVHAPPHALYIARCLANLGKLIEARATYRELRAEEPPTDAPAAFREAWLKAERELAAVERRVVRLRIELSPSPASARVSIDGRSLAPPELADDIALDPGPHHIAARAEGYRDAERDVTLAEGSRETVTLTLAPLAGPDAESSDGASDGQSVALPAVVIALGGAGLVVGAVTGGLAIDKQNELADACPQKTGCSAENKQIEDDGRALGTASTVAFIAGGVIAGAGIVWLAVVLSSEPAESSAVAPGARDSLVGLTIRFQ
jgi:hypothetical protein